MGASADVLSALATTGLVLAGAAAKLRAEQAAVDDLQIAVDVAALARLLLDQQPPLQAALETVATELYCLAHAHEQLSIDQARLNGLLMVENHHIV